MFEELINKKIKVVFKDDNIKKVLRGILIEEDAYLIKIRFPDNKCIMIGKKDITKITEVEDD